VKISEDVDLKSAKLVATFDGKYGRDGVIVVLEGECDVCGRTECVLVVDQSEGEYWPGSVCIICANKAFGK